MKKLEYYWPKLSWRLIIGSLFVSSFFFVINTATTSALVLPQANNPQATAVGLSGTVTSPPPSVAATIGTPTNGQVFTTLPITVQGICQSGLLIKLYINSINLLLNILKELFYNLLIFIITFVIIYYLYSFIYFITFK